MKASLALVLAFLCAEVAGSVKAEISGVQKVIELLNGMIAKGEAELHAEERQYGAYSQWCTDTQADLKQQIMEMEEAISVESAQLDDFETQTDDLQTRIAANEDHINHASGDQKAATSVRAVDNADFERLHKDHTETIDALSMAIDILSKQNYDRPQASFVQLSNLQTMNMIPEEAKRAISVLLQGPEDDENKEDHMSWRAPEANAYEFQSEHVIDMLKQLLSKFNKERTSAEVTEREAVHSYELLMADLKQQTEAKTSQNKEMKMRVADIAESTTSLSVSKDEHEQKLARDQAELKDTTAICSSKATDFTARQQLRQEELDAIRQAKEILSGDDVLGAEQTHLSSTSLAQLLRADMRVSAQVRAAQFLRSRAKALDSATLSALVATTADDPFVKVKEVIYGLITRLEEEAASEATTKAWCDKELSTNEQARTRKATDIERLTADVDSLETSVAKLAEEIADLSSEIATLQKELAEATEVRAKEKAHNAATVKDARDAQVAISEATAILQAFYDRAAGATALVQQQTEQPDIFDSPYTGMQGRSDGVLGLLEVIMSDFAKLESETGVSETEAQADFEKFQTDTTVTLKGNQRDVENKSHQKSEEEAQLSETKEDLRQTEKELAAKVDEFNQLKPTCVATGVTFKKRDAARAEEIEALQEALHILEGEGQ